MKAKCYDPAFPYIKAAEMGPDYLQKRFAKIRRKLAEEAKEEQERKVRPIRKVTSGRP